MDSEAPFLPGVPLPPPLPPHWGRHAAQNARCGDTPALGSSGGLVWVPHYPNLGLGGPRPYGPFFSTDLRSSDEGKKVWGGVRLGDSHEGLSLLGSLCQSEDGAPGNLCWILPTFLSDQNGSVSSVPYFRIMLTITGKMQVPRAVPWEKSAALTKFSNGYLTPSG